MAGYQFTSKSYSVIWHIVTIVAYAAFLIMFYSKRRVVSMLIQGEEITVESRSYFMSSSKTYLLNEIKSAFIKRGGKKRNREYILQLTHVNTCLYNISSIDGFEENDLARINTKLSRPILS